LLYLLKTIMLISSFRKCTMFWSDTTNYVSTIFQRLAGMQVYPHNPCYCAGLYENKTQSYLLVLELVQYRWMRWEHSWSIALGMTSHTDMSRSYELLRQTSSDGTVPEPLNCTNHIWFWNNETKPTCNIKVKAHNTEQIFTDSPVKKCGLGLGNITLQKTVRKVKNTKSKAVLLHITQAPRDRYMYT
jgi:hypothetical protein